MRFSFCNLRFFARLPSSDRMLAFCWLGGIGFGCALAAVCKSDYSLDLLFPLFPCLGGISGFFPYLWFAFSFGVWGFGLTDYLFFLSFLKGLLDAFTLCLLLSASDCLGWISVLRIFAQHFLLIPVLTEYWRCLLRNDADGYRFSLIAALNCIFVFLFFSFYVRPFLLGFYI